MGRMQVITTTKATDWPLVETDMNEWKEWSTMGDEQKISKLAESLYQLYSRFGEPDRVSLLDGRLSLGWRTSSAGVDRYEEVSMDAKLLCYPRRSPRGRGEVHLYINGYESPDTSAFDPVRPRIDDMASSSQGPRGRNRVCRVDAPGGREGASEDELPNHPNRGVGDLSPDGRRTTDVVSDPDVGGPE